jgi:hypothetical protein
MMTIATHASQPPKCAISLIASHLNLSEARQQHIITSIWIAASLSGFSTRPRAPIIENLLMFLLYIWKYNAGCENTT